MSSSRSVRALFSASALVLLAACASAGANAAGSESVAMTTPGTTSTLGEPNDRSAISEEQLASSGESAYEIIQRLHPEFLRTDRTVRNSGTTQAEPAVVQDGRQVGTASDLRRIPAATLNRIRYFSIDQAKRRFGMQYSTPVIEIGYRQR